MCPSSRRERKLRMYDTTTIVLASSTGKNAIVQSVTAQLVQPKNGQMPKVLGLTTFTNLIEISCRCKVNEERLFYILYASKEHFAAAT